MVLTIEFKATEYPRCSYVLNGNEGKGNRRTTNGKEKISAVRVSHAFSWETNLHLYFLLDRTAREMECGFLSVPTNCLYTSERVKLYKRIVQDEEKW